MNRDDNPADDGSKGLKIDTMLKDDRWLKGPKFPWKDESYCFVVKGHMMQCKISSVLPAQPLSERLQLLRINTARSAFSSIDIDVSDVQDHTPVGKHFLVFCYLGGVFNKIKPVPRYNNIWSVDTVLDYLSLFWPLDEISLKELTLKLVMLIALTTGQRCQTLTFLDISEQHMQKDDKCFNFALTSHLKQDKPGQVFGNVCLYKYPV